MSKCSKTDCNPTKEGCMEGHTPHIDCQYWNDTTATEIKENQNPITEYNTGKKFENWSGYSFGYESIGIISLRNAPIIIGVIGDISSGKTTFLSMLYLMLSSGKGITGYDFAGSYTIMGWELISYSMRFDSDGVFNFPPRTTSEMSRKTGFLHLAMKHRESNKLKDFIFTDTPGEWFLEWSESTTGEKAQGGKFVIDNADGFIFLLDSEGLTSKNRGEVKHRIQSIGGRLKDEIYERPVGLLWSKSDKTNKERQKVINKLTTNLKSYFPIHNFLKISYEPGQNNEFHNNIIKSIEWLLREIQSNKETGTSTNIKVEEEDYFFMINNET